MPQVHQEFEPARLCRSSSRSRDCASTTSLTRFRSGRSRFARLCPVLRPLRRRIARRERVAGHLPDAASVEGLPLFSCISSPPSMPASWYGVSATRTSRASMMRCPCAKPPTGCRSSSPSALWRRAAYRIGYAASSCRRRRLLPLRAAAVCRSFTSFLPADHWLHAAGVFRSDRGVEQVYRPRDRDRLFFDPSCSASAWRTRCCCPGRPALHLLGHERLWPLCQALFWSTVYWMAIFAVLACFSIALARRGAEDGGSRCAGAPLPGLLRRWSSWC